MNNAVVKTFVICVVALGLIEIQKCLAPQNDFQHLSIVKGTHIVGKNNTRNGLKMAKCKGGLLFKWPVFTITSVNMEANTH